MLVLPFARTGSRRGSALIAAVALALLDLGHGVGLPVLRDRAAHVILLGELPLLVTAGVALVALVRLDQLAVSLP
jgi:hypothetical protein